MQLKALYVSLVLNAVCALQCSVLLGLWFSCWNSISSTDRSGALSANLLKRSKRLCKTFDLPVQKLTILASPVAGIGTNVWRVRRGDVHGHAKVRLFFVQSLRCISMPYIAFWFGSFCLLSTQLIFLPGSHGWDFWTSQDRRLGQSISGFGLFALSNILMKALLGFKRRCFTLPSHHVNSWNRDAKTLHRLHWEVDDGRMPDLCQLRLLIQLRPAQLQGLFKSLLPHRSGL